MNKYKVEIKQIETYVLDVKANNEQEAKDKAQKAWNKVAELGMQHYKQVGEAEMDFGTIYDVTSTDDPFDAE